MVTEIRPMSKPEYGEDIDEEPLAFSLDRSRRFRLAMNVLWDNLEEVFSDTHSEEYQLVVDALFAANRAVTQVELAAIRKNMAAEHYLLIKPVNRITPPPPEIMKRIGEAIRTLVELEMVIGQSDAVGRDYYEVTPRQEEQ
jgi:hypothetical protein